jgi:hypothetical protein
LPNSVATYRTFPDNWPDYAPNVPNGSLRWCPTVSMSHYNWSDNWPLQRPNRYAYVYVTDGPAGNVSTAIMIASATDTKLFFDVLHIAIGNDCDCVKRLTFLVPACLCFVLCHGSISLG